MKRQQQHRVRATRQPQFAFGWRADPRIVAAVIADLGDQLKVQVRWPAQVLLGRAQPGDLLAGDHALANVQVAERTRGQVAVEAEQALAVQLMFQDHGGAVIPEVRVVGHAVHAAGQCRVYLGARRQPQVHAQVQAAGLIRTAEQRAHAVDRPVLAVAAGRPFGAGQRQFLRDPAPEGGGIGRVQARKPGIGAAQVQAQAGSPEVLAGYRRRASCMDQCVLNLRHAAVCHERWRTSSQSASANSSSAAAVIAVTPVSMAGSASGRK